VSVITPRYLLLRYTFALILLLAFLAISHLASVSGLSAHTHRAKAIEVSAQQSVLSQQILFYGDRVADPSHNNIDDVDDLNLAINRFERAHKDLTAGNTGPYGTLSPELDRLYFVDNYKVKSLNTRSLAYVALARKVAQSESQFDKQTAWLKMEDMGKSSLLNSLNRASREFENMAQTSVARSKNIANVSFLIAMALLALEAIFIFVPSIRTIGTHVKELQDRNEKEKRLNMQLSRSVEREVEVRRMAQSASHAKTEFLAKMSHELRTPMNGIIGVIDLLKETKTTDQQSQFISIIETSGDKLLTIINSVLEYSDAASDNITLENKPFALMPLIDTLKEQYHAECIDKKLGFHVKCAEPLHERLLGDEKRLEDILTHLLDNAVAFTDRGQVTLSITHQKIKNGYDLSIAVKDTGAGIDTDLLETIFDNFNQVDNSYQRDHDGLGLGLTLARQYARAMSGDISVSSVMGEGSTFTLELFLPLADTKKIADPVIAKNTPIDALIETTTDTGIVEMKDHHIDANPTMPADKNKGTAPALISTQTIDQSHIAENTAKDIAIPNRLKQALVTSKGPAILVLGQDKTWHRNWHKSIAENGGKAVSITQMAGFLETLEKVDQKDFYLSAIIIDPILGRLPDSFLNTDSLKYKLQQSRLIFSSSGKPCPPTCDTDKCAHKLGLKDIGSSQSCLQDGSIDDMANILLDILRLPQKNAPHKNDDTDRYVSVA